MDGNEKLVFGGKYWRRTEWVLPKVNKSIWKQSKRICLYMSLCIPHTSHWMLQIVARFFFATSGGRGLHSFVWAFHCNVHMPDIWYAPNYTKCTTHPIQLLRLIGKWNMFVTPNQTYFIHQVPLMCVFMRVIEGVNEIIINMIWREWDGNDRMGDSSRLDVQSQLLNWTDDDNSDSSSIIIIITGAKSRHSN